MQGRGARYGEESTTWRWNQRRQKLLLCTTRSATPGEIKTRKAVQGYFETEEKELNVAKKTDFGRPIKKSWFSLLNKYHLKTCNLKKSGTTCVASRYVIFLIVFVICNRPIGSLKYAVNTLLYLRCQKIK